MSLLALASLWVVAIAGFADLFTNGAWIGPVAVAATVPLVVEWSVNRARASDIDPKLEQLTRPTSVAIHLVAFLVVIGLALFPTTMLLGIVPTPATIGALFASIGDAQALIRQSVAPIDPAPPFVSIAVLTVWWCAAASGAAMWSSSAPALAAAPPVTIFVATQVYREDTASLWPIWLLLAAVVLVIVSSDYQRIGGRWWNGLGPAVAVVGILVVGSLLGPRLPGYGAEPWLAFRTTAGTHISDNPLVDIKPRLSDASDVTVFYVCPETQDPTRPCDSSSGGYWRLTSLDRFDGRVFSTGDEPPILDQPEVGETDRSRVYIHEFSSPWLPSPLYPLPVDKAGYVVDPAANAALVEGRTEDATAYQIAHWAPNPSAGDLRAAPPADASDPEIAHYLSLPDNLPPGIDEWGQQVAAGQTTPFDRMYALRNELRTFEYTLEVEPGHSAQTLEEFLVDEDTGQKGYCEQFATALAVLARTQGVPSRVAIGYLRGTRQSKVVNDELLDLWEVRGDDAHAWTELWFPGYGWVAFDPTPPDRSEDSPSYNPQPAAPEPEAAVPAPVETTVPPAPEEAPVPEEGSETPEDPLPTDDTSTASDTGVPWGALLRAFMVLAIAVAIATFGLWGKALRRRRRRRHGIAGSWQEALDILTDAGLDPSPTETPNELAARATADGLPLGPLAELFVAYTFGPDTELDPGADAIAWDEVDELRRGLRDSDRKRAFKAELSWRSLLPARQSAVRVERQVVTG